MGKMQEGRLITKYVCFNDVYNSSSRKLKMKDQKEIIDILTTISILIYIALFAVITIMASPNTTVDIITGVFFQILAFVAFVLYPRKDSNERQK
jgi:TRAP-type uncharacterized transport system fused permease subunit